jgi:hypothetical protein
LLKECPAGDSRLIPTVKSDFDGERELGTYLDHIRPIKTIHTIRTNHSRLIRNAYVSIVIHGEEAILPKETRLQLRIQCLEMAMMVPILFHQVMVVKPDHLHHNIPFIAGISLQIRNGCEF